MAGLRLDERDRRILGLAVPALFTLAVEPLYVLVDTAIVGRLGAVELASLALAATVLTTAVWLFNFLSFAVTTRVAVATGAGDHHRAATVAGQALWLATAIGVPLAVLLALLARPLVTGLGGPGPEIDGAVTYLRISALSVPAVLLMIASQGVYRGWSDMRTPLRILLASNVVNVVVEVVLVFGLGWGIAGSAWSTVVAQLLAVAWFLGLIGRAVRAARARLAPARRDMAGLLADGRHLVVRTGALVAALALATAAAGRLGTAPLGGHQIAVQTFVLLALVVDALAIAAQAIVGTAVGAGDAGRGDADTRRLLRLGVWVGAGLTVLVAAASPVLPRLFTADAAVIRNASIALLGLAAMQVPAAVTFVLDGVLMGRSEFRFVKFATVTALVAFAPVAVAVMVWPGLGIGALWAGLVLWVVVRGGLNLIRYRAGAVGVS